MISIETEEGHQGLACSHGLNYLPPMNNTSPSKQALNSPKSFPHAKTLAMTSISIYDRLLQLDIQLPSLSTPAAAYVPFVQSGPLVFLSGHIAKRQGQPWVGQLGRDIDTATGQQAARAVAIDLLGTLHAAVGDLHRVRRIVKVMSLVNSTPQFTEQHLVTNGCSELLCEVFGAKGAHARSAFGVAQIPMGACVEIELIAELESL